jgi:hypothetical protein
LLQFASGSLYLYSGYGNAVFFNGLCAYNLTTNVWTLINPVDNADSTNGGGCLHDNYLYSFFGWNTNGENCNDHFTQCDMNIVSTVTRLNLLSPDSGWENVAIHGCENLANISFFGYSLIENNFYALGGEGINNAQNSIIYITLDNSANVLYCNVLVNNTISPRRRNGSTMEYIRGSLYLFGGYNQGTYFNDFWQ